MARATKLRVVGGKDAAAHAAHGDGNHSLPLGTACPNCGTALAGPWCHACGQKGEDFHRSIWRLAGEALEGFTELDGRLWKTLPRLVLKPGRLTRDYLDGHRAAQIPPFRLFLIVLLLVFFAGALNFQAKPVNFKPETAATTFASTPEQLADFHEVGEAMRTTPEGRWLLAHGQAALKNPEAFLGAMERWSHEFAILLLPIAALALSVLFLFKRGVYVFDHLIFSMHSLSFQGLLLTGVFLGGLAVDWAGWFLWIAPAHLFIHMRGTYGISSLGALIRMFLLFVASAAAFIILMLGLVFVGLATVR
jgi:hypothetical protein